DFAARFEIVEGTDGVPHFDGGRRIAQRQPVPHLEIVGAVMNPGDLAELDGVQHEGGKSVLSEPDAVPLILGLGAVWAWRVTGNIEDRWRLTRGLRQIQIACDIKARHALEDDVLDAIARA